MTFLIDPETGDTLGWRNELDTVDLKTAAQVDHAQAAKIIAALLAPARDDEIHVWLADLSEVTARRSSNEAEGMLTLAAYTDRLRAYPGDIVRHVLREWAGKWFPTWGELKAEIEIMTRERIAIRDKLMAIANPAVRIEENPVSQRIDDLREELATLNRQLLKYPELAGEEMALRRAKIITRIEALQSTFKPIRASDAS